MIDPTTIFTDPRWRYYRTERTAPHGVFMAHDGGGKQVVLPLRRSRPEGDAAISVSALNHVANAVRDGRQVQATIALTHNRTVLAHASVQELVARIGDAEPRDGIYGPYHWVDASLKLVTNRRGAIDEKEPF
jgi:hypothetical protein